MKKALKLILIKEIENTRKSPTDRARQRIDGVRLRVLGEPTGGMPMFWRKWYIGICVFGITAALLCSPARGQDQQELGFHFSLDGQFRYGNISGFVQIP